MFDIKDTGAVMLELAACVKLMRPLLYPVSRVLNSSPGWESVRISSWFIVQAKSQVPAHRQEGPPHVRYRPGLFRGRPEGERY